jgi:hypothetical protein
MAELRGTPPEAASPVRPTAAPMMSGSPDGAAPVVVAVPPTAVVAVPPAAVVAVPAAAVVVVVPPPHAAAKTTSVPSRRQARINSTFLLLMFF